GCSMMAITPRDRPDLRLHPAIQSDRELGPCATGRSPYTRNSGARVGWPRPMAVQFALVEILDEDDFVLFLVVDELVHLRAHHQQTEAARPQPFLLADVHV